MTGTRRSIRVAAATAAATTAPATTKASGSARPPKSTAKTTTAVVTTANTPTKRRAGKAVSTRTTGSKKKLKGLSSAVKKTDTTSHGLSIGVIDPECTTKGIILDIDGHPCDIMLALVDPAKNIDKYFILQLIQKDSEDAYVVYTRWGRTGSKGQALEQDFPSLDDAQECFLDKFKQKSALDWKDRDSTPTVGNKYRFVTQDFGEKNQSYSGAKWQYWVDDQICGKADGWYDYDTPASKDVERLFHEHAGNPQLSERTVESGTFEYKVDMTNMTQTNLKTQTARRIQRQVVGAVAKEGNDDEEDEDRKPAAVATTPAVSTPQKTRASKAVPVTPNVASTPSTPAVAVAASAAVSIAVVSPNPKAIIPTVKKSGNHPVDTDIAVHGKVPGDYKVVPMGDGDKWFDAVLNQCNIGNNNNKYYRLQLLKETSSGSFFVWFKWGRVGESAKAGATTWAGPFNSLSDAKPMFMKKYREKSGNAFGVATFVEKTGKYVPVEVDNDVEVNDSSLLSSSQPAMEKVEYAESVLDAKTKELIEVLFSKEMRSEALTSFNLDLRRLPLGVPSKAQIEHGISILRRIEDKLSGIVATAAGENLSYQELSSRFYTAIPHSFGRSVPPTISTKDSLQSRFDMCNILLDMYQTNETVKRIEAATATAKKEKQPNQVDQFYESLHADLVPVHKNSEVDKTIRQYFEATKGSRSSSLLDIWSVDRQSESKRFQQFDEIDNRRLLWHGTNIAVVAPILTTGLRIMPHSGGRVGSGIYLANLQQKSAQYTSGYGSKFACMFLCEAPLGKAHLVDSDGPHASGLKAPPKGYDSVQAVGMHQPKSFVTLTIDDKELVVPNSSAVPSGKSSSFSHDEFLVYNEKQVRLRYIVTVKL